MAEITTSIVIQFTQGDEDAILTAQVDSREDGRNGGNTNFFPGQVVYYLITKTDNVRVTKQTASAGYISFVENSIEDVEEFLTFANESEASTSNPIYGSYSTKWLGRVPNATLVKSSPTTFRLQSSDGSAVDAVAVLKINYKVLHIVYKLSGLGSTLSGESSYEVVISIIGESP